MEPLDEQQQIGFLIGAMQDLRDDVKSLRDDHAALKRMVEDKFKTAELTFKILKFFGLALLAVLTFKFGDVRQLWFHFFG